MPMLRRQGGTPRIGFPPIATVPLSSLISPATIRSVVVFPHPLDPSRVTSSPSATSRETPSTDFTAP